MSPIVIDPIIMCCISPALLTSVTELLTVNLVLLSVQQKRNTFFSYVCEKKCGVRAR